MTEENKNVIYNEGVCPYCKSENVEHGVIELDDAMVYYPVRCSDCSKMSREYHDLTYIKTVGYE